MSNMMNVSIADSDKEISKLIDQEHTRQTQGLELIASENYASQAVMQAQGSVLTNKYAEGYPGKRYYDGCEYVDQVETLAINRAKMLFGANYANVQPHSGSSANFAVYLSFLKPGDKILGMDLSQGGHLTHGSPVNFSGKLFEAHHYGIDLQTERLNYDMVADIAKQVRPKMIIAGASAYPRSIDFSKFQDIAKSVGALLIADMAHIAGLVAARLHQNPVSYCDFVTSTTHKTLRGPRGGLILSQNMDYQKSLNSAIFPGIQGGPLEHVIAAKAVCFGQALTKDFQEYQKQVISNAQRLAVQLQEKGVQIVSGGTDNHLILIKTDSFEISGKDASLALEKVGLTCNKNMVPGDNRSPFITSGVRIGTPAITTRGMKENEMDIIAKIIFTTLSNHSNQQKLNHCHQQIQQLCKEFPIYELTKN